jgi:hypothetical protein
MSLRKKFSHRISSFLNSLIKMTNEEREKTEVLDKAGDTQAPHYTFEVWLSTDGKHSVHCVADTPEGRREAMRVATQEYDYILERYGTKQAQAVKEYGKGNGDAKPEQVNQDTCKHINVRFAQSKTEKNPGRWFKSCADCGKFLGWKE